MENQRSMEEVLKLQREHYLKEGPPSYALRIDRLNRVQDMIIQNKDRIITGQNVAAIPDHPKITNQKIVRFGDKIETLIATNKAKKASASVTFFERFISDSESAFGFIIC